jgi:hypothetical protein
LKIKKERVEENLCDNIISKQSEKEESKEVEDDQELVVKKSCNEIPSVIKVTSSHRRDLKKILSFTLKNHLDVKFQKFSQVAEKKTRFEEKPIC